MLKGFLICCVVTIALADNPPPNTKVFHCADATVRIVGIGGGSDVFLTEVQDSAATDAIVIAFYNKGIQHTEQSVLLSQTITCPVIRGAGTGCDAMFGLTPDRIVWIRVKLLKKLKEIDIK